MAEVKAPGRHDAPNGSLASAGTTQHDLPQDDNKSNHKAKTSPGSTVSRQDMAGHGHAGSSHSSEHRHSTTASESDDDHGLADLEHVPSRGAEAFQEITHVRTTTSIGSSASRPPDYEVVFEDGDNLNPKQWSLWYRTWITVAISYTTWVVVFYSTAYTAAIPGLLDEFGAASPTVVTLGVTTYLLGLAAGSLLVAPASELYGRRPVYIICMACFTLLVIPCCLATSLTEIIVVRFFWYG